MQGGAQQGSQINPAILANPQFQQVLQALAQHQATVQRPGITNPNIAGAQIRPNLNRTEGDDESSSSSSDED